MKSTLVWITFIGFVSCVSGQEHVTTAACSNETRPVSVASHHVSLLSPGYPGSYDPESYCEWILEANSDVATIYLKIESFNTESCCDHLRFFSLEGEMLLELDGTLSPGEEYTIRRNAVRAVFTSDYSVQSSGFDVSYTAFDEVSRSDLACSPLTLPFYITSRLAHLRPLGSGDREYCFWVYSPELGPEDDIEGVYLGLQAFRNLEPNQVAVYGGQGRTGQTLWVYDGQQLDQSLLWVHDTVLSVEYSSIDDTDADFNITFFTRDSACSSGTAREVPLSSGSGSIQSPAYPFILPEFLTCNWVITTTPGQTITLYNAEIDILTDPYCDRDFLEVIDGPDVFSPSFGRFCNNDVFTSLQSTGNALQVILRSDEEFPAKKGFRLMYSVDGSDSGSGDSEDFDYYLYP